MTIRLATPLDIEAVVACADQAFANASPTSPAAGAGTHDDLLDQIGDRHVHVILGGPQSAVVGYISLLPIADHLFVESIAVMHGYQGRGLGTEMLVFAEQEAWWRGLPSVRLFTKLDSTDSFSYYQYRGYTETFRCDDDGHPRIFYRKDIARAPAAASGSMVA